MQPWIAHAILLKYIYLFSQLLVTTIYILIIIADSRVFVYKIKGCDKTAIADRWNWRGHCCQANYAHGEYYLIWSCNDCALQNVFNEVEICNLIEVINVSKKVINKSTFDYIYLNKEFPSSEGGLECVRSHGARGGKPN